MTQVLNTQQVPEIVRRLALDYNPVAYLIVAHHKIFICRTAPEALTVLVMLIGSLVVLFLGHLIFEKFRDSFAEEV